jgi:hypothetical protein
VVWRFSGLRGLRNCWRELRSGVFLVGLVLEFFSFSKWEICITKKDQSLRKVVVGIDEIVAPED